MKKKCILAVLFIFLLSFTAARADWGLFNPSMFSAIEIVQELPGYWMANPYEIQEFMSNYPDISCSPYTKGIDEFDHMICSSVNNRNTFDIIINFWFWGDNAGMAGLEEASFAIGVNDTECVQSVMESLWLSGSFPYRIDGKDEVYPNFQSLIFLANNTVVRYELPDFSHESPYSMTIEFRDIALPYRAPVG